MRDLMWLAGVVSMLGAGPAHANDTPRFQSPQGDLPVGELVFPGDGKADAINANCVACHSAEMVLNQPAPSRGEWTAEVTKMIKVYKAPVEPEAAAAIVAYLAETKGRP